MFKQNIGIVSEFANPMEDLLCNIFASIGGCLFLGSHPVVFWSWLSFRLVETIDAHCGYNFPFSPFCLFPSIQGGADKHEFHHAHNVGNFGSFFVFWDWIMGTDAEYNKYVLEKEKKMK